MYIIEMHTRAQVHYSHYNYFEIRLHVSAQLGRYLRRMSDTIFRKPTDYKYALRILSLHVQTRSQYLNTILVFKIHSE